MIDDIDLAIQEKLAVITGNDIQAKIIRNARRYLALREHGVLMGMPHNMTLAHDEKLDAAADRLLEGGK